MKPRILIVTGSYPGPESPVAGVFIQDQARVLSRRFDVAVLVLKPRWVSGRELIGFREYPPAREEADGRIQVLRQEVMLPVDGGFRFLEPVLRILAGQTLERALKAWGRPSLIHAHVAWPAGWAAAALANLVKAPLVLTEHTGPFAGLMRFPALTRTAGRVLARADRVLAVSPALASQMREFFPALSVDVLGNVVLTEFFSPPAQAPAGGPFRFLSAALLDPLKGMDYLLDAAKMLRDGGARSFSLTVAGDGSSLSGLKERAKALGIADMTDFPGLLPREALRDAMRESRAFVLPSLGETFSVVLGEAASCGLPVVATLCGGPEFVVTREMGVLVPRADAAALADAMAALLSGRAHFDPGAARRSVASRFGEEAFLDDISRAYAPFLQE